MRSNSRIILILGLGGDLEADAVQAMTNEHDTLWLEAPFGTSFDSSPNAGNESCLPSEEAHAYFAGAPAVQTLRIEDVGALQRAADAIAARHGHLDMLVIGSHLGLAGIESDLPWQRFIHPYRFDGLAAIVTCLPLLMRSSAARIVDLGSPATAADSHPLLAGTSIGFERVSPLPGSADDGDVAFRPTPARGADRLTTL